MRFTSLAFVAALLLMPVAARADVACGDQCDQACGMPCCAQDPMACGMKKPASDPNATPPHVHGVASPRQTGVVFFQRPVLVGRTVLFGKYIIEHDTDRQARGEPCTYIYAAAKPAVPVVTFHCEHLDAVTAERDTVVLRTSPDGISKLLQFQFAGETAAHGYPAGR